MKKLFALVSLLLMVLALPAVSQPAPQPAPRALIVVAHPDDESCFAATVYEITHNLGGTVDQLVITNGEGGYRYSLLAETIYGVALTDEKTGRAALPEIRKRELLDAGRILGIANHYFLDQRDVRYTQDVDEVLETHWQKGVVTPEVRRRLEAGHYDFVFTLFPSPETHGGHKASTFTALEAVQTMTGRRPVVLGCQDAKRDAPTQPSWAGYQSPRHPFTSLPEVYQTDRAVKFGFKDALSYQIIVNWMVAAHKSQGAFQAGVAGYDLEQFVVIEGGLNNREAAPSGTDSPRVLTKGLFEALAARASHPKGVDPTPEPAAPPAPSVK